MFDFRTERMFSISVRIDLNIFFAKCGYGKRQRRNEMAKKVKKFDKFELNAEMLVSLISKLYSQKRRLSL